MPIWSALSPTQRDLEFETYPKLERHYKNLVSSAESSSKTPATKRRKVAASASASSAAVVLSQEQERSLIVNLIDEFLLMIGESCAKVSPSDLHDKFSYLAVFVGFITDLLSQLTTRRFLHVVLRRRHFLVIVRRSALVQHCLQWSDAFERSSLTTQLSMLEAVLAYPIDAHTGKSLSPQDVQERSSQHIQALQQHAFQSFRSTRLEGLAILPVSFIVDRATFAGHLSELVVSDKANFHKFAVQLGVISDTEAVSQDDLIEYFLEEFSSRDVVEWQDIPVSLTELNIWGDTLGSTSDKLVYGATGLVSILPVRKLGLQFLNLADCLQRNYDLVRLEAAGDARSTLENSIKQLDAVRSLVSAENQTIFRGFSPLATPLQGSFKIQKVTKPSLGDSAPALVLAEFEVELEDKRQNSSTFDKFHPNEIVYLVSIRATNDEAAEVMGFTKGQLDKKDESVGANFAEEYGVLFVRTAHIVEILDSHGSIINEENPTGKGRKRTVKVSLDGKQYKNDLTTNQMDAYKFVNVMIRKNYTSSNLETELESVMDTWRMSESESLLPSWLHDVVVGYGDPVAASYQSIYKHIKHQQQVSIPLLDAVVDGEHVVDVFSTPEATVALVDIESPSKKISTKDAVGPFTYTEDLDDTSKRTVHAHRRSGSVATPADVSTVRFTRSQAAALCSGLCEGLTVISGAPQTGKTEVATQLVANLCRQESAREKILVIAHSNRTLDTFVEKIIEQNKISEAAVVRLGPSQEDNDFNSKGRVKFLLQRRSAVLQEVALMAQWIESKDPTYAGLGSSVAYSCDNALFFYKTHAKAILDTVGSADESLLKEYFTVRRGSEPLKEEELQSFAADMHQYFFELKRVQPFEMLQTTNQRADMYLMDQARVITMTCADVAMNRGKLIHLGLQFSTLLMEDASEAREIDTLLPLLMTSSASSSDNLKRVVLMGDPAKQPAIDSKALSSYAHLNQSLFARLIRLGVPAIELEA